MKKSRIRILSKKETQDLVKGITTIKEHICSKCRTKRCLVINSYKTYCLCNDCIVCCFCQKKDELCQNCLNKRIKLKKRKLTDNEKDIFVRGDCNVFAVVLHKKYGYELYGIFAQYYDIDNDNIDDDNPKVDSEVFLHVVAYNNNDDLYLDIYGQWNYSDLHDFWVENADDGYFIGDNYLGLDIRKINSENELKQYIGDECNIKYFKLANEIIDGNKSVYTK